MNRLHILALAAQKTLFNNLSLEDMRRLRTLEIQQGSSRAFSHPSHIDLYMVNRCSANCVMCGVDFAKVNAGIPLCAISLDNIKAMERNLDFRYVETVNYSGGEPLLNAHLPDIMTHLKAAHPATRQSMISNGTTLRESLFPVLSECLRSINFSVNAATAKTYNAIMQTDAFDKTVAAIASFARYRKQNGKNVSLTLSMVLSIHNLRETPAFIELAKTVDAEVVSFLYARFYTRDFPGLTYLPHAAILREEDSLFSHQQESDEILKDAYTKARAAGLKVYHEPLFSDEFHAGPCEFPWTHLMVNCDGAVYPCCGGHVTRPKVLSGEYKTGNIFEQPLKKFWNNAFFRSLRRSAFPRTHADGIVECRTMCSGAMQFHGPRERRSHIIN